MRQRVLLGLSLTATGLLAGMFTYGALNVAQAFKAVPLDVRFTYHVALMNINGWVMQTAMGLAVLATLVMALVRRGRVRLLAGVSAGLGVATFGVTRFGNVPINRQIREWVATSLPRDHAQILDRWEMLHYVRTVTAVLMFVAVVLIAVSVRRRGEPA